MEKKIGYQHYIDKLDKMFPDKEMLTKTDVQRFTGLNLRTLSKQFTFSNNKISKSALAEAMA